MFLYRFLISVFASVVLIRTLAAGAFGDVAERLGRAEKTPHPHLWLHGASNGEIASAKPLILCLLAARPELRMVITTNSVSGRDLAAQIAPDRVEAVLAPVDLRWSLRRFVKTWRVTGHITLESELWPNRIGYLTGKGLPIFVFGARMTAGTAKTWAKFPSLGKQVLQGIAALSAQDVQSAKRFEQLGLPPTARLPEMDLKSHYRPTDHAFKALPGRENIWLAASTHPGEDDIVLQAHKIAMATMPDLRLILAPRHPDRGPDICDLARAKGLSVASRSQGASPEKPCDVYVADSLGEMDLWYRSAGRVFVGGSLVNKGGHTPYEPAYHNCALITGPYVGNFKSAYHRLTEAGAVIEVSSAQDLATALLNLTAPETQAQAGQTGKERPCTDRQSGRAR